ncbi:MAG: AMP-binding protein [Dehalococcoidales bacterium]
MLGCALVLMTDEDNERTIPSLLYRHYDLLASLTALAVRRYGRRQRYNWGDYYEKVRQICLGLISLGLRRGDIVAFIGENEPERMWAELAVWAAGGAVAIVPPGSTASETRRIFVEVGARIALVGGEDEVERVLELKSDLPDLAKIVCWDRRGLDTDTDPSVVDIAGVMQTGKEQNDENPALFEDSVDHGKEVDLAVVVYSPGDSGLERGVRLSHRAMIASARGFVDRCPPRASDMLAANRPVGSVTDNLFSVLPHLLKAIRLEFPRQPAISPGDTGGLQPTFIMRDAEQWTALAREITEGGTEASSLQRTLLDLFLPVGRALGTARLSGRKANPAVRLAGKIADLLVFRWLRFSHGLRRIRFAASDSGPIDEGAFRTVHAIGVDLRRSYFSTEAGLIAIQGAGEIDPAAVGRPVTGVEVRVSADGRLLVRGDGLFDGYQGDTGDTAALTEDGWWDTGDTGSINEKGQVVLPGGRRR